MNYYSYDPENFGLSDLIDLVTPADLLAVTLNNSATVDNTFIVLTSANSFVADESVWSLDPLGLIGTASTKTNSFFIDNNSIEIKFDQSSVNPLISQNKPLYCSITNRLVTIDLANYYLKGCEFDNSKISIKIYDVTDPLSSRFLQFWPNVAWPRTAFVPCYIDYAFT